MSILLKALLFLLIVFFLILEAFFIVRLLAFLKKNPGRRVGEAARDIVVVLRRFQITGIVTMISLAAYFIFYVIATK